MGPVEMQDRFFNSVFMSPEVVSLEGRQEKAPPEVIAERFRKLPWYGQTVESPTEVWLVHEKVSTRKRAWVQHYIASFKEAAGDDPEIVVVTAMHQGPGMLEVIMVNLFAAGEFDHDRWRYGIPLYGTNFKGEDDARAGLCWAESLEAELFQRGEVVVRDYKGEKHIIDDFPWREEDGRAFVEILENRDEIEEMKAGTRRCLEEPDRIVTRPMVHPDNGRIVDIHVYKRNSGETENGNEIAEFASAIVIGEKKLEFVDFCQLSDPEEKTRMMDGIILYDREKQYPLYQRKRDGYINVDTGELIETRTQISSMEHPNNPDRKLWAVVVVRHPVDDPPFIVDVKLLDKEKDVNQFRQGELIFQKDQ